MKNLGHRLGASGTKLENTIEGLLGSTGLVSDRRFKYWEFDTRESSDGILFVFHDDLILKEGNLIPTKDMKFDEIYQTGLSLGIKIPKFKDVIKELKNRSEKTMIEIKYVNSDSCRDEIFNSVADRHNWMLMSTPSRFIDSFPDESREYRRNRARELDLKLVRVGRHKIDLFRASNSRAMWRFAKIKWFFGF